MTHVKIRRYANFVSSLLAYLISAVASWFSNSILSRFRMSLQNSAVKLKIGYPSGENSSPKYTPETWQRLLNSGT